MSIRWHPAAVPARRLLLVQLWLLLLEALVVDAGAIGGSVIFLLWKSWKWWQQDGLDDPGKSDTSLFQRTIRVILAEECNKLQRLREATQSTRLQRHQESSLTMRCGKLVSMPSLTSYYRRMMESTIK
ncbi:hypothetical protein N7491_007811 [Penicillium cf. griseofulvum]|uniref:Uncharacterized protein n=1 Tax=Penicillium cf. griseofulvum TaxID=2972120 RepID=A0A9W9IYT6_9EURO|nr:hypothetical protein N7472_009161 [Penicillium cf. griseofulvum]KAJ5430795.1 hypothetical protein N7491_007811 [Penicillium cf. griseofulvum]KAJ5435435.1 hypothetical protein N7445_006320 [Penicillium cf. griseofulvum]